MTFRLVAWVSAASLFVCRKGDRQMSRKKRKAKINPVFSNDILNDKFSMMYVTQLRSKAYIELSLPAKLLYCTLRVFKLAGRARVPFHAWKRNRHRIRPGYILCLSCISSEAIRIQRQAKRRKVAGVIKKVESNWNLRQVTVYQFVSDWKT